MVKRCLLIMGLALALSGCAGSAIDFAGMDAAQRAFNERARQEFVAFMSLETMFPDPQVRTLAKAAGDDDIGKVEELAARGVDVNSRGKKNATPLFWSMSSIKGFRKLLELGADPNVVFDGGGSVMHWAARAENMDFQKAAIQHGGDVDLKTGPFGETPLFRALSNREAMTLLLDSGADIDARTSGDTVLTKPISGDTPVMTAASIGQYDAVYELLNRGADYRIKNAAGFSLVDRLARKRSILIPESDESKWLQKVVAWLEERGVEVAG